MKVVYNPKGFGLNLNEAEMKMFVALRGYRLRTHPIPTLSSVTTWFVDVDWEEFRTDPLLVRLCEEGMLSNENLAIREWDEEDYDNYEGGWGIQTDYHSYENVFVYLNEDEDDYEEYDDETQGETA
jgi:hypothetical protein